MRKGRLFVLVVFALLACSEDPSRQSASTSSTTSAKSPEPLSARHAEAVSILTGETEGDRLEAARRLALDGQAEALVLPVLEEAYRLGNLDADDVVNAVDFYRGARSAAVLVRLLLDPNLSYRTAEHVADALRRNGRNDPAFLEEVEELSAEQRRAIRLMSGTSWAFRRRLASLRSSSIRATARSTTPGCQPPGPRSSSPPSPGAASRDAPSSEVARSPR